jgi:ActR/RegA family two-component response regulator
VAYRLILLSRTVAGLDERQGGNTRQFAASRPIVNLSTTHQEDLCRPMENHPKPMTSPLELEFVLLSNDYATMNAVSGGLKKYGAKFNLVPTVKAARDCLARRKVDGVFVDMAVGGALELIEAIRAGTSNRKGVIFGCILSTKESTAALNAGANFLLRKPLSVDSVALHLTIAKDLLVRERRRYFRHAVNLAVVLRGRDGEQLARMTNLSEEGMALRATKPLKYSSAVDFAFELAFGLNVTGKGQVAWTNTEGMAGIMMETIHGKGREFLEAWLTTQEKLGPKISVLA